jgi:hypothetical protein
MPGFLFTLVCEFAGGTYIAQIQADDERQAINEWASFLIREQPMGATSNGIAMCAQDDPEPPTPIAGLSSVWCWTALVGDERVLANIVRSA